MFTLFFGDGDLAGSTTSARCYILCGEFFAVDDSHHQNLASETPLFVSLWPWDDPLLHAVILLLAIGWDRWLGEPPVRLHPVVWMGHAIGWMRSCAPQSPPLALVWGLLMATLLPVLAALLAILTLVPFIGIPIAVWLLTSCFAIRALTDAGLRVATALDSGDLEAGRAGLGWLCSRDPSGLDATSVAAAATESIAENTSDSLVAPLLWYAVGGLPGALAYRCVNTLDAMIGYRDRYEWLGKASARLDDFLNLTALLILVRPSSKGAPLRGFRTLFNDRSKTESPNAGWPMAAMAGLLGVELAKPGLYVLGAGLGSCDSGALRQAVDVCGKSMVTCGLTLVIMLLGFGVVVSWS